MEILKSLISTFKEILYDIIGYMIPGLFLLIILFTSLISEQNYSFMYTLYAILFNSQIKINYDFINSFKTLSFIKIFLILFFAYLLGHLSIYLSSLLKSIGEFFKKKFKWINSYETFCDNILNALDKNPKFPKELFKNESNNYNKDFILTYASTYSRFKSHDDLIQKYICKINFYSSISFIFFILSIDSFISYIYLKAVNTFTNSHSCDLYIIFIISLLFINFLAFLKQYYRHRYLKEKECYLFLYEYFK